MEAPASSDQVKHAIAGLVAFFSLLPGIGLVSRRLRKAGRLSGAYRYLRHLSWLVPALFITSILLLGPIGLTGLGQRIFIASVFTWIILAAHGLARGAFLKRD